MTEKIVASREGIGAPYVLAPKRLADSLFQQLASANLCGSPPQDAISVDNHPTDCIIELCHNPQAIEETIDIWFIEQNITPDKSYDGDAENPIDIIWEFETAEG